MSEDNDFMDQRWWADWVELSDDNNSWMSVEIIHKYVRHLWVECWYHAIYPDVGPKLHIQTQSTRGCNQDIKRTRRLNAAETGESVSYACYSVGHWDLSKQEWCTVGKRTIISADRLLNGWHWMRDAAAAACLVVASLIVTSSHRQIHCYKDTI